MLKLMKLFLKIELILFICIGVKNLFYEGGIIIVNFGMNNK